MKKQLVALTMTLTSFTSFTAGPVDRIGVKGPLTFNKTTFDLTWSDKPNATYSIQEYLPQGETAERFNQMLTLHLFAQDTPLKSAVNQKLQELETRKQTDPTCNYQVTEGPGGKEFIVDFLLGVNTTEVSTIVEFNIYRYKQVDLGKQKQGIVIYAYTKRAYGDQVTPFLKNLRQDRPALLNKMITAPIPTLKPAAK
ncbi:hypothetical protein [Hymenobacter terrenus]|uniref:hypothetical protein n=1 Tax=Hymenobacter terrenus TaxID=1629124 RepID=UPI000619A557|nr:hypothetical protein [Hymenobacter terrenus]